MVKSSITLKIKQDKTQENIWCQIACFNWIKAIKNKREKINISIKIFLWQRKN